MVALNSGETKIWNSNINLALLHWYSYIPKIEHRAKIKVRVLHNAFATSKFD
jgi:hypothetical protein